MKSSRLAALMTVAIILSASFAVGIAVEESDDSDGFILTTAGLILVSTGTAAVIIGAVAGVSFTAGYLVGTALAEGDGSTPDEEVRGYEAETIAQLISDGVGFTETQMESHSKIWSLTNEHWIRQSELAASELWMVGGDYSPSDVLSVSGTYLNSSYMLVNAAVQINEQYSSLSRRADAWNSSTLYDDKMSLAFTYESRTLSTTEGWGCTVLTVAESVAGYDEVYISGGEIWAFGSDNATLTSASGDLFTITGGHVDLDDYPKFKPGVYRLQTGVSYAGSILPVYSFSAADVNAGMVLRSGDITKLAQYEGGKVIVDGYQYDGISLSIIPDGAAARSVNLTETLSAYDDLLHTVFETMGNANSSAKAVWNIYNAAGKASTYLTTLTVPDNYANVDLTVAQKEILTVLALEQLSEYYQSNSGMLKTQDYVMSDDSMSFFVRGDIKDSNGSVLYENAIYTPFYYFGGETMVNGTNVQTQRCIVAIWDFDVDPIFSWDRAASTSSAKLIELDPGAELNVYEMTYGGEIVNFMELKVNEITLIKANDMDHDPLDPPDGNMLKLAVMAVLCILGLICIVSGYMQGSIVRMGIGVMLIVAGIFFAGYIAEFLDKYIGGYF